MHENALTTA